MIDELADVESDEFELESYSIEGQAVYLFKLVVNGRLYQFELPEGWSGSDERYDVSATVEIMNAIAIRQRLKRRFFVYETQWDLDFRLVMFLLPETAEQLQSRFGLRVVSGCEFYMHN